MKAEFEDSELIGVIQEAVKPEIIKVDDKAFSSKALELLPRQKLAEQIAVHSLTAIVDYLKSEFDGGLKEGVVVIVKSPTEVCVSRSIGVDTDRRFWPIAASAILPSIAFGQFRSLEETNIALQAGFVQTPERDELIRSLGSIVATESLEQADDGVSQAVTVKAGIKRTEDTVKNPVTLAPFRTFAELPQPTSPFIIRLRKPNDEGMTAALFEADGGAWNNVARLEIKRFLDGALGDVPVLA